MSEKNLLAQHLQRFLASDFQPAAAFAAAARQRLDRPLDQLHGHMPRWQDAIARLPRRAVPVHLDRAAPQFGDATHRPCSEQALHEILDTLHPWRKGPLSILGTYIDTEWRSDLKWQRIAPHLAPLSGRRLLDVGCGNGYHCLRALGANAAFVLGIDPGWQFAMQFHLLDRLLDAPPLFHLPMADSDLPPCAAFDTVLSMGVLYHRRNPLQHLQTLHGCLRRGGQLVLETLVVGGDAQTVLTPRHRYARMGNVWFIPSTDALLLWVERTGFHDPRLVDLNVTTTEEQRSTNWMRFQSLRESLSEDGTTTVEGLPRPTRAVIIAERP